MKKRIARRVMGVFGMPEEMLTKSSVLTLTSDGEVSVEGCRRVCDYQRERVELALADVNVTVYGEGLTMRAFYGRSIRISGRIRSIELS